MPGPPHTPVSSFMPKGVTQLPPPQGAAALTEPITMPLKHGYSSCQPVRRITTVIKRTGNRLGETCGGHAPGAPAQHRARLSHKNHPATHHPAQLQPGLFPPLLECCFSPLNSPSCPSAVQTHRPGDQLPGEPRSCAAGESPPG